MNTIVVRSVIRTLEKLYQLPTMLYYALKGARVQYYCAHSTTPLIAQSDTIIQWAFGAVGGSHKYSTQERGGGAGR